ncbi:uncharacterized protein PV07_01423 [Cladophialophora immunda]|uniref:CHAT domain-containing protein n=1 Tax=Cladophialophora immunda TaxID=569365 RepID=A0A0D2A2Z7_9EURO|nr:uncharacterized protein PV07_01423 [Cladophialophora immunda]KIW34656.1 hypothetical protein PV07_01423 [Cladophialophora immunda]
MNLEIHNCKLAYLSACESAFNGERNLREESLHVAGAFLLAGIPSAIATWRPILDEKSMDVAEEFDRRLMTGRATVDVKKAAEALHGAVSNLRQDVDDPFVWASYAHFGC